MELSLYIDENNDLFESVKKTKDIIITGDKISEKLTNLKLIILINTVLYKK